MFLAGDFVAQRGSVGSLQNYELTFTMKLASEWRTTGSYRSVFLIDSKRERLPGIWFHSTQSGMNVAQTFPDGIDFEAGAIYQIKLGVEDGQTTLYVDGVDRGPASVVGSAAAAANANLKLYVGDPWYAAAKATLSDVSLKEFPTRGVRIIRGRYQDPNDFQCVTDPSVTEHDGKKIAFACCEANTCSRFDPAGQCYAGDLRRLSNFAPKSWYEATNACAAEGKVLCGVDTPCSRSGCSYDLHYQWTGEACQAGDFARRHLRRLPLRHANKSRRERIKS